VSGHSHLISGYTPIFAFNFRIDNTEGAQYLAEHAGAYWLLDEIAFAQPHHQAVANEAFQVWTLAVQSNRSATLTCDDGNGNVVFTKQIPYTDFMLDSIKLYFANDVIHLPSEY